jgi:hypothetical protein
MWLRAQDKQIRQAVRDPSLNSKLVYGVEVCALESATLSHSCEDASEGGPGLAELASSSKRGLEPCGGGEEVELTSRFVKAITSCIQKLKEKCKL